MGSNGSVTETPPQILTFGQAPALAAAEKLMSFPTESVEVRWRDNHWQLLAGGTLLKDFGHSQRDAEEALRILRAFRINQHGTVGNPQPVIEYWVSDGQAPQGFCPGLHLLSMDLASLTAEPVQGHWCIHDAHRLFFSFGSHESEARAALETIRRYGFTQVGFIGAPVPAMMYFIRDSTGFTSGRMAGPAPLVGRRVTHAKKESIKIPSGTVPPGLSGLNPQELGRLAGPLSLATARQLSFVMPLAGDQPALGDRIRFDPRHLQVRCDDGDWRLESDGYTVARFGPRQADALQAQELLRSYGCNEHCCVGGPRPAFSFFLANGQAPRGQLFGLSSTRFRPESLTLRSVGADWFICEENRVLLRAGASEDDAHKLLEIIRRFKFDALCRVGQDETCGMTILVRTR